jgi:glycosyltransferase involved in cell wall biosynthesis
MVISIKKQFSDELSTSDEVKISVIIAAKNEENNIETLIESLKNQNYSPDNFEIILVDDHSTDNTAGEIEKAIKELQNFKVISLSKPDDNGKRNALQKGIEQSRFPFILITDADCKPEPNWLRAHATNFSAGNQTQFGIAPFEQKHFLINKVACFENLRGSILTFSLAGLGLPYSAAARNFGFTKRAFNLVGGYSKTKNTLSGDDDLFLREAIKQKIKIGTVTQKGSLVYSKSKETFREYLNQRARHTQTSLHYLKKQQIALGFWHLLNLFSLLSVGLMFLNLLWGVLLLSKLAIDTAVIKVNEKKFGYKFNLLEIFPLQITYELLLIIHFINARFMKIKWK